jgi:type IV pilus assembly protein PilW
MQVKPNENRAQGFTVIELLLAVAIAGIIMASFYSIYMSQQRSYRRQSEIAAMNQNIRSALFYMGKEIRMAGLDPTGAANAGIVENLPNRIRFTEDVQGQSENDPPDGNIGDTNEDISYFLADPDGDGDTDLVRDAGFGRRLIAENISSLLFDYLDGDGNTTGSLPAIRFVEVTLKAVTANSSSDRTITSRILCRNLEY